MANEKTLYDYAVNKSTLVTGTKISDNLDAQDFSQVEKSLKPNYTYTSDASHMVALYLRQALDKNDNSLPDNVKDVDFFKNIKKSLRNNQEPFYAENARKLGEQFFEQIGYPEFLKEIKFTPDQSLSPEAQVRQTEEYIEYAIRERINQLKAQNTVLDFELNGAKTTVALSSMFPDGKKTLMGETKQVNGKEEIVDVEYDRVDMFADTAGRAKGTPNYTDKIIKKPEVSQPVLAENVSANTPVRTAADSKAKPKAVNEAEESQKTSSDKEPVEPQYIPKKTGKTLFDLLDKKFSKSQESEKFLTENSILGSMDQSIRELRSKRYSVGDKKVRYNNEDIQNYGKNKGFLGEIKDRLGDLFQKNLNGRAVEKSLVAEGHIKGVSIDGGIGEDDRVAIRKKYNVLATENLTADLTKQLQSQELNNQSIQALVTNIAKGEVKSENGQPLIKSIESFLDLKPKASQEDKEKAVAKAMEYLLLDRKSLNGKKPDGEISENELKSLNNKLLPVNLEPEVKGKG